MDETRFWNLIETSRDTEDLDDQLGYLTGELENLSIEELVSFDDHLTRLSHALHTHSVYGAAHAILSQVPDDIHPDIRSWIISRGRDTYTHTLTDPDTALSRLSSFSREQIGAAETMSTLVNGIYQAREGLSLHTDPLRPSADQSDSPPRGANTPWTPETTAAAYPLLTAITAALSEDACDDADRDPNHPRPDTFHFG